MNSLRFFAGRLGWMHMQLALRTISVIGAKSRTGS
jgi:hypothetical protein